MTAFFPVLLGICLFPVCLTAASQMFRNMDTSADPCDNFYEFACGNWKELHSLSDVESKGVISVMTEAKEKMRRKLKTLLETPLNVSESDVFQFAMSVYGSCMDIETIEALDTTPLTNKLVILRGWPVVEGDEWNESEFDWLDMLIEFRNLGFKSNVFYFKPTVKEGNSSHAKLQWETLDFWLIDKKMDELSSTGAYFSRMKQSAVMLGANLSASETELSEVLNFEKELLKIRPNNFEIIYDSYDDYYNTLRTVTELEKLFPQFPWSKWFRGMFNIEPQENEWLEIQGLRFLLNFAQLIRNTDKRTVANYMIWKVVEQSLPFLSSNWTSLLLVNTDMPKKPRWEQCLDYVNQPYTFRDAIDSYYVRKFFGSRLKEFAIEVVEYVRREYINMFENNSWLDNSTKEGLIDKALVIDIDNIGFPDRLLNKTYLFERYENTDISNKSYLEVDLHLRKVYADYRLGKLRKPITKNNYENYLAVTDVNAHASVDYKSIEISVGFLELLFHKDRPQYLNFGALGQIAGYVIAHHFIRYAKVFDKEGLPLNWPAETDNKYLEKALCFVSQYDNYEEQNGMKINGSATNDENIADNEGFKTAYRAYQTWVQEHGYENLLPGINYTQNQLFWLSAANRFCAQYSSKKLAEVINVRRGPSTPRFRVIGSMSNLPEFSRDFNCPSDSPMNRIDKCNFY